MRKASTVIPLVAEIEVLYEVSEDDGIVITKHFPIHMQVADGSAKIVDGIGFDIRAALNKEMEEYIQKEEDGATEDN